MFDLFEHSEQIGGTVTFIVLEQQPTLHFILSNIVTIPFISLDNIDNIIYINLALYYNVGNKKNKNYF